MRDSDPDVTVTSPANSILFGPDGLRAGWCLMLYLVIAFLFDVVAATILSPRQGGSPATARLITLNASVGSIAAPGAAWVMARIEGRPFARFGLGRMQLLPHLAGGALAGMFALSLLVGVLWMTHALVFGPAMLHGWPIFTRGLGWLLAFFLVALQEEFVFRGYLQFTASRAVLGLIRAVAPAYPHAQAVAFWRVAAGLSGLLFMALHLRNGGETPAGIAAVGLAGITFAYSLWRTGSLWWAIGFHMTWDWAQSFVFGVPDSGVMVANHWLSSHAAGMPLLSGGSAGPEGSVLVLPTLLLVCLGIHLGFPRRAQRTPPLHLT